MFEDMLKDYKFSLEMVIPHAYLRPSLYNKL